MAYASKEWTEKYLGTTLKAARAEGLLVNGTDFVPVGTIIPFMGVKAPKDYLICDGAVYQISSYSDLASFIERQFGAVNHFGGDGTTTFAVPDLRGEFLRGSGANSHTNQGSGGLVGEHQDATRHLGVASDTNTGGWTLVGAMNSGMSKTTNTDYTYTNDYGRVWSSKAGADTAKTAPSYTSRPTNTSVLYCIKATNASDISITNNYLGMDRYIDKEICIGEYKGKPLYRKMFNNISFSLKAGGDGTWSYDTTSLVGTDAEFLVNAKFFRNNKIVTDVYDYQIDSGNKLGVRGLFATVITDMVLDYTKTTDADDSFTPSMIDNNISIGGVGYTDYSDEEKVIGKWRDGRPVYRKVLKNKNFSGTTTGDIYFNSAVSNIEMILNYSVNIIGDNFTASFSSSGGSFNTTTGKFDIDGITYFKDTAATHPASFRVSVSSNGISDLQGRDMYLSFDYVKSTDAPNSFKPSMVLGGVSIEEASDEDVKEVW